MDCKDLIPLIDSYIADELLVETNHEILRHLENCANCRGKLAERREFRSRVRNAVLSSDKTLLDSNFSRRLTNDLRELAMHQSQWERFVSAVLQPDLKLASLAAILIAVIGFGMFIFINRPIKTPDVAGLPITVETPEPQSSWYNLASVAVGDHKNCALDFHLTEDPISLTEGAKIDTFAEGLDKIVLDALKIDPKSKSKTDLAFFVAHYCLYNNRRFSHIVITDKGRVVSFIITENENNRPGNATDDIYTSSFEGLNVAGFQAGNHSVYVVSDMDHTVNSSFAQQVEPSVKTHAANFESKQAKIKVTTETTDSSDDADLSS